VPMGDVTADIQRDIVALWGGPGFHIVHYPLRHGTLFNIVGCSEGRPIPSVATWWLIVRSLSTPTAARPIPSSAWPGLYDGFTLPRARNHY
jgi:hypothetical protein